MIAPQHPRVSPRCVSAVGSRCALLQVPLRDADFHELRRAYRRLAATAVLLSVGSYLLYILLSYSRRN